ncbi:hypothetical protein DKM44_11880 [Deinococcus irradiatisoli]|uniref:Bacterial transcriptional activator domain-containing protein n=2 Tax=Deinococcus irradiatisoli TaxID=2202254 RepID=A0A2Z3JLY5_9DEIO|nr:hypothetical protein DKM44_11880 [Deinococcus irradiatisoli]
MQLRVMGTPSVRVEGREAPFRTRRALALVLYLALEGPQPHDALLELLWPEAPRRGSLRTAALHVRGALGAQAWRLSTHWCGLSLDMAGVQLDALTVDTLDAEQALAWGQQPFLAGLALRSSPAWDDYLLMRGEALRFQHDRRLSQLAEAALQAGDFDLASALARRRCDLDPLSEDACRQWTSVLSRAGLRRRAESVQAAFLRRCEQEYGALPAFPAWPRAPRRAGWPSGRA